MSDNTGTFNALPRGKQCVTDPDGQTVAHVDGIVNCLAIMETEHHEIHHSRHYTCSNYKATIAAGATHDWLIRTPASNYAHFVFDISTTAPLKIEFRENVTVENTGSYLSAVNNNRNAGHSNKADVLCYVTPTIDADIQGKIIWQQVLGSLTSATGPAKGSDTAGLAKREREFILKQNEDYVIRVINLDGTAGAAVVMTAEWYEVSGNTA